MSRIAVAVCTCILMGSNSMARCSDWLSDPNIRKDWRSAGKSRRGRSTEPWRCLGNTRRDHHGTMEGIGLKISLR
ncbi:MAG: hypothetical protein LBJ20_08385 [Candidatus Methanoplasma sp.]|nr:hypothetical protein [Candidatus Methanoplasma sp.]